MEIRISVAVWLREQDDKLLHSNVADKLIFISGKKKQNKYYRNIEI